MIVLSLKYILQTTSTFKNPIFFKSQKQSIENTMTSLLKTPYDFFFIYTTEKSIYVFLLFKYNP